MKAVIEVDRLSCKLGGADILKNLSFSLESGSRLVVVGPNGSGKTTLLRCLLGIHASSSSVYLDEERLESIPAIRRAAKLAYVPQAVATLPAISATEFLRLSRYAHSTLLDSFGKSSVEELVCFLELVKLEDRADKLITTFSQGEKQRLLIAAALCQDSPTLLLDEPTAFLDPKNEEHVFSVLGSLSDAGKTILMVSHDVNRAALFADRILALKDGELQFSGLAREFMTAEALGELYGDNFCLVEHPSRSIPMMVPK